MVVYQSMLKQDWRALGCAWPGTAVWNAKDAKCIVVSCHHMVLLFVYLFCWLVWVNDAVRCRERLWSALHLDGITLFSNKLSH